jgi:hypothetical protein
VWTAIVLGGISALGSWRNLTFNVLAGHFSLRYSGMPMTHVLETMLRNRLETLQKMLTLWWPIAVVVLLALIVTPRRRPDRASQLVLLILAASSLLLVAAPEMEDEYFVPLVPFVALLAVRALPKPTRRWLPIVPMLAACLSLMPTESPYRSDWYASPAALAAPAAFIASLHPTALATFQPLLAIEARVPVAPGYEMGVFSVWPDRSQAEAARERVLTPSMVPATLRRRGIIGAFTQYELATLGLLDCVVAQHACGSTPLQVRAVFRLFDLNAGDGPLYIVAAAAQDAHQ